MSKPHRTRRAAVYLRVSLDATGEHLSVDRHREDCHKIASERGWTTVAEYLDNSITASKREVQRPGYNAMVEDYEAGKFDAILCYDHHLQRELSSAVLAAEHAAILGTFNANSGVLTGTSTTATVIDTWPTRSAQPKPSQAARPVL